MSALDLERHRGGPGGASCPNTIRPLKTNLFLSPMNYWDECIASVLRGFFVLSHAISNQLKIPLQM
jgi:hypothetical protein